ncbi:MAG: ADP-forming succinate--CoA ligase subunit beta [Elusimicrobia bacterium]|nr:ADP-forming succinate--CoA ligase subunit beta [Elusimicrobiota bacterium]MDE2511237.1 ADP-forming succinate--CoA ligase subunit beta [Elusimicrobiota bacterium]
MKLLEHEAKDILKARGIPVPPYGGLIKTTAGLTAAMKRAGKAPWVLKAQVLAGGRGKAGGIKLAKTPKEAKEFAKAMIGMDLITHQTHGQALKVKELLIEGGVKIERELYFSVVMDRKSAGPMIIASAQGGMEIETLAVEHPEALIRMGVDPNVGLRDFAARRLAFALEIPNDRVGEFCRVAKILVKAFIDLDCSMLEINPLILTPKGVMALDAKVTTDANASFRHPELAKLKDHEASALELEAKAADISYVGLDGTIGCMVNGAGLAMGTMDTIALAGGSPANFLDVGGGANEERVTKALQIILKDKKVKAILINIFGGIVKCDMIAAGVVAALKKIKLKVPLVVRLQGTNVEAGREILAKSGIAIIVANELWDAAQKAVAAAKGN